MTRRRPSTLSPVETRTVEELWYRDRAFSHQVDVLEDLGGTVHLAQDHQHLVADELLELRQVANHLHLQLGSDLRRVEVQKVAVQQNRPEA